MTESRSLPCKLTPQALAEKSDEMARLQLQANQIESEKKAASSQYKSRLDTVASQMTNLASIISDRAEYKPVKCKWVFETAGRNAETGDLVFHPEQKTLIREGTSEVVEIRTITDQERQMSLPLDDA